MKLAFNYVMFAVFATLANIGGQEVAIRLYNGIYALIFSMLIGTAVGLIVKYLLDKRYIFRYRRNDSVFDSRTFLLYTCTGIATTAIFWGCEFTFHILFQTKTSRYLGAIIGLAVGYLIKYQLDKRFVFRTEMA